MVKTALNGEEEAGGEVRPWEVNKSFIVSTPVTSFWLSQKRKNEITHRDRTGIYGQRTLLLNETFSLPFQLCQITTCLSLRSSGMSIASADRNLSLTFHFIAALKNIQQNAFETSFSCKAGWKQIMVSCSFSWLWVRDSINALFKGSAVCSVGPAGSRCGQTESMNHAVAESTTKWCIYYWCAVAPVFITRARARQEISPATKSTQHHKMPIWGIFYSLALWMLQDTSFYSVTEKKRRVGVHWYSPKYLYGWDLQ